MTTTVKSVTFAPIAPAAAPMTDRLLTAGVVGTWAAYAGVNTFSHVLLPRTIREESKRVQGLAIDPARWAFSIWFSIFAMQGGYAAYQASAAGRANPRVAASRLPMALSFACGALWPVAVAYEQEELSYALLLGMLGTGAWAYGKLRPALDAGPSAPAGEVAAARVPTGVYTGWLTVAAVVGGTSVAARHGVRAARTAAWANAGVALAGAAGAWVGARRGDLAYAGAVAWGLTAVAARQRRPGTTAAVAGAIAAIGLGLLAGRRG